MLVKIVGILWRAYLAMLLPVVAFCICLDGLLIHEWLYPDFGLEGPRENVAVEIAFITFAVFSPAFWLGGVFFAHRFRGRWRSPVPFLAQIIIVGSFTWANYEVMRSEGDEIGWVFLYLAGLICLLVVGFVVAIFSESNPSVTESSADQI